MYIREDHATLKNTKKYFMIYQYHSYLEDLKLYFIKYPSQESFKSLHLGSTHNLRNV